MVNISVSMPLGLGALSGNFDAFVTLPIVCRLLAVL